MIESRCLPSSPFMAVDHLALQLVIQTRANPALVSLGKERRRPVGPSTAHHLMECFNRLLPFGPARGAAPYLVANNRPDLRLSIRSNGYSRVRKIFRKDNGRSQGTEALLYARAMPELIPKQQRKCYPFVASVWVAFAFRASRRSWVTYTLS